MLNYISNLFRDLHVYIVPDIVQAKAFFVLFGIVTAAIGYWLKQIVGAVIAAIAVFGIYLYATGFFYRGF